MNEASLTKSFQYYPKAQFSDQFYLIIFYLINGGSEIFVIFNKLEVGVGIGISKHRLISVMNKKET